MPKKSAKDRSNASQTGQLGFFGVNDVVVHYFDKDGALRSGRLLRRIKKGKKRGAFVVADAFGKPFIPPKIRNIEYLSKR
jgi:hypothetical protein